MSASRSHSSPGSSKLRGRGGRVLFPLTPFDDESLPGFLARTAAWNVLESPWDLVTPLAAQRPHLMSAASFDSYALAEAVGVPHPRLVGMIVDGPSQRNGALNFYGRTVPRFWLDFRRRRFSPSSLRNSPHHRARWMVGALSFCPESWELLIEKCHECNASLGWLCTKGIEVCERCEADLRFAPSDTVAPSDRDALTSAADLFSISADRRAQAAAQFPEAFGALDAGELFDIANAFARAAKTVRGPVTRTSLTSADLARGVRMMQAYPASFEEIAGRQRSENTPVDPFFVHLRQTAHEPRYRLKTFLQELLLQHEPVVHGPTRLAQLRSQRNCITVSEAARRLRIDNAAMAKLLARGAFPEAGGRGTTRRLYWLKEKKVAQLGLRLAARMSAHEAQARLGIPREGLEQCVSIGLIRLCRDPFVAILHPGLQVQCEDVARLLNLLVTRLHPRHPERRTIRLEEVFHGIPGEKPWGPLLAGALADPPKVTLQYDCSGDLSLGSVLVEDEFARDLVAGLRPELRKIPRRARELPEQPDFSRIEVERYLNCYPRDISWLIAHGHLNPRYGSQQPLPRDQVEALGASLISSREITWRWRVSAELREALPNTHGIDRLLGPFWPRPQVTEHFLRMFPHGRPV